MKRTITAVTSSRTGFSHLYWPLRELAARRLKLRDRKVDKLKHVLPRCRISFSLSRRAELAHSGNRLKPRSFFTAMGPRLSPEFGLTGGFTLEDLLPAIGALVCR